jgi:hypothetical protein
MDQKTRVIIAAAVLILILGLIVGLTSWQSWNSIPSATGSATPPPPGSITITVKGQLTAYLSPADLDRLGKNSFTEPAEGKLQEGWLLSDILRLYLQPDILQPETTIIVSSSSRHKSATLTWAQVNDPANWVMFDLSNRGTFKLVSVMEQLDSRDEWIQDTDHIEIEP